MNKRPFQGKNGRFPAYDDETGVKLNTNNRRVLFDGHDDLITDYRPDARDMLERATVKHDKKLRRVQTDEGTRSALERQKNTLPDYGPRTSEQKTTRSLFEEKKPKVESSQMTIKRHDRNATPFSPTYVPESLIPDESDDRISMNELYQSMKKNRSSYLRFGSERDHYQQPTIQKRSEQRQKPSNQRLDRSLQGIMNDDTNVLENSKYFHD
ncbi:hypothetical protein NRIC_33150 [Enterococcus florum]|uniref:Uncharacterized protein n=1 Tax=Enterococcus florum TaxID=2480627 RepID=A0A4P5PFA2_9ENTE|nr:hypothetical protein [Enterococcus florum]GCF95424.1 hypothetical protein NRIC_33150 [Enterococcus florum]